ncbi:hypothetical protein PHLGIDRAFT_234194 [Phlebiopsis gigantea 11061_1 CR5-6]|uniref:Uncharacterized protein n=1 Tax=Phlebiopsis gigantea (strain 11061_1 CR5-6) TaxID=745531 RepID=A0A0C3RSX7_PHLG1|nr:hypothetical protein PHLGIDRAFT_234194 [Phlebiopsis gigantea 11061_1 CR5-6]
MSGSELVSGVLLASIQFGDPAKAHHGERPTTKLTITRKGRHPELIDHVVITALILQRNLWD